MTLMIAMTFLIGFSAQGAFAGFSPVIYDEPLDGTIIPTLPSLIPLADDFVIVTATTITDFHVLLLEVFPGGFDGNVQYAIYEDDNGLPGALVPDGSGTAQDGMTANPFSCLGLVCFDFWANLETPVELLPGTYWIAFSGQSFNWAVVLDDIHFGSEAVEFTGIWVPLSEIGLAQSGVSFSITGEADLPPPIVFVDIDIKPGSFPNSVNFKSKGVLPVAILTTDTFDATTVDPGTVIFDIFQINGSTSPNKCAIEDVDGDGDLDLVCHFSIPDIEKKCQGIVDGRVVHATGQILADTFDGLPIQGQDSIRWVQCPAIG